MPTSAVTGTSALNTGGETNPPDKADAPDPAPDPSPEAGYGPKPLADPNGNGTVQVTNADGSTSNFDACQDGWEDEVAAIDPKHPALNWATTAPLDEYSDVAKSKYDALTVEDLKDEIRDRNDDGADIKLTGTHDELVERLEANDKENES
jgi:hypothetical protein